MPARAITAGDLFSESTLFGFLFTLTRISGVVAFLPLPGIKATPEPVRITLALAFTIALSPLWTAHKLTGEFTISRMLTGLATEAALGLGIGVVIAIAMEVFQAAAQVMSLQAGFSYASTIDPTSGADSPVLVMLAQMTCALLFVTTGADQAFFRILAESIAWRIPGGAAAFDLRMAGVAVYHFASIILLYGLRLAAPIAVLLLMADVLLAVFGRLQPALQLTSLAFPLKLASTMVLFTTMLRFYPRFFESVFGQALRLMEALLRGG